MEKYARDQASLRLNRLAFELRRAAKSPDADSIHDLRVSIRRFTQCLKTFSQFFPSKEAKKVRRRLRTILKLAAEVRDRDIALELLAKAPGNPASQISARLARDRKQAEEELAGALARWRRREFSLKCRNRLQL